ncbi:MAG TPA: carboxypeptidase regulatory-like domain-containing protein [Acidimicrobiales bacterium]|jgi:hypothetical protein
MGVLTEADDKLRAWLQAAAGGADVVAGPPRDAPEDTPAGKKATLGAYLLAIEPVPRVATDKYHPAPVVLHLRYLVVPEGPDDRAALELVDRLLEATYDTPLPGDLDVDLAPAPTDVWQALGARPRPAVTVQLTARFQPRPAEVEYVREQLHVVGTGVRSLGGRVLGPGDIPLAGAEVVVAATRASTRTSNSGTFRFPAVPTGPDPVRLAIRAKGRTFSVDVDPSDGEPVVVRCDLLEA